MYFSVIQRVPVIAFQGHPVATPFVVSFLAGMALSPRPIQHHRRPRGAVRAGLLGAEQHPVHPAPEMRQQGVDITLAFPPQWTWYPILAGQSKQRQTDRTAGNLFFHVLPVQEGGPLRATGATGFQVEICAGTPQIPCRRAISKVPAITGPVEVLVERYGLVRFLGNKMVAAMGTMLVFALSFVLWLIEPVVALRTVVAMPQFPQTARTFGLAVLERLLVDGIAAVETLVKGFLRMLRADEASFLIPVEVVMTTALARFRAGGEQHVASFLLNA